jgi:hypothetical protein
MRREAGNHENFFIAKNRDSESTQRVFNRHRRVPARPIARRSLHAQITETSAARAFLAILTIEGGAFSRVTRIAACIYCCAADERVLRVLAAARQHFLKQDAVFFNVLVYSGCSAFRFPSARSD